MRVAGVRPSGPSGRIRWTEDMQRMVAERTRAGHTAAEISRDIGVSPNAVSNLTARLRQRGWQVTVRRSHRVDWTEAMDAALRAAVDAGRRVAEVAAEMGITPMAARRRIAALGLTAAARRGSIRPEQKALLRRVAQRAGQAPRLPRHPMPERGIARQFPHRVTIADLRLTTCRFPTWANDAEPRPAEAFYCGAPVEPGKTYCPDCRAFVFAPRAQGRVG